MSMPPPWSPTKSRPAASTNLSATAPDRRPGSPVSMSPTSATAKGPVVVLGVCAMDVKARSKAMREILTRLVDIEKGGVDVKIFGDVVILEEGESSHPEYAGRCVDGETSTTGRLSTSLSPSSRRTSPCPRLLPTRKSQTASHQSPSTL